VGKALLRYAVPMEQILRGGRIVSHSGLTPSYLGYDADIVIRGGLIQALVEPGTIAPNIRDVDVSGLWLLPGFAQVHTHLVQTLFRGMADDLELLQWLRQRIWPLEAAHDDESTYWSARIGLTEMLLGGTTAILDMASVNHTDSIFQAAQECGMRAHIGKAMMDLPNEAGLAENTDLSLQSSCELRDRWHNNGRLRYAFAPRFVPSCSPDLLKETVQEARTAGCLIHSHASENVDEVELVRSMTGKDNVEYLDSIGMMGPDVVLAHCIHLSKAEINILANTQTAVAHCPSSNFKLGSGLADTPRLLSNGVRVGLGSDGAPCNNRMDIFAEMRLAALMQKPRFGASAIKADAVLDMATRAGADLLQTHAGDIKVGSPADIIALDPNQIHSLGNGNEAGTVVYAMTPSNVRHVWIDGDRIVQDGELTCWDLEETVREGTRAAKAVQERAGL
jgi:cytosine/adenosine deaminase-related metal-dependent hydrolase